MRYIDRDNLPWVYDPEAQCIDGRLRYVCDTGGLAGGGKVLLNEQDAEDAVEAVNYHDQLVEALRSLLEEYEDIDLLEPEPEDLTTAVRVSRILLRELEGL